MELVDIISEILIYGSVLLVLVVAISFIFSRAKSKEIPVVSYQGSNYRSDRITPMPKVAGVKIGPGILSNDQPKDNALIFRLENQKPKEIKIVRKPTSTRGDSSDYPGSDFKNPARTNGDSQRYTIVNEEINKQNNKAFNFYL